MDICKQFSWSRRIPKGDKDATNNRFGCTATLLGHFIYVLGGSRQTSSMSLLNLQTNTWSALRVSQPERFEFILHTANLIEDKIVLFGLDPEEGRPNELADMYILDPLLLEIQVMRTFPKPRYRQSHSIDLYERRNILVMFGGFPKTQPGRGQLKLLDLDTRCWFKPLVKGSAPSPRGRHGSCMIGSRLFIYGGDAKDSRNNNVFIVDLAARRSMAWAKIRLEVNPEFGRIGPGFVHVGAGRLLIFGGYCTGNLANSNELFLLEKVGRPQQKCSLVKDSNGLQETSKDEYAYSGIVPPPRESPCMVLAFDRLYVIGGNANDGCGYYVLEPG